MIILEAKAAKSAMLAARSNDGLVAINFMCLSRELGNDMFRCIATSRLNADYHATFRPIGIDGHC